jgi:hypothetical protein
MSTATTTSTPLTLATALGVPIAQEIAKTTTLKLNNVVPVILSVISEVKPLTSLTANEFQQVVEAAVACLIQLSPLPSVEAQALIKIVDVLIPHLITFAEELVTETEEEVAVCCSWC